MNVYGAPFFPDNPDDIVLINKFYKYGLTERDVYLYYMSCKDRLLKWIDGRHIAFLLKIDDTFVLKRKISGAPIVLHDSNYDKLITGRTLCVYVERPSVTDYFVIDIDGGDGVSFNDVVKASKTVISIVKRSSINIKNIEVLFTSERGCHCIIYLKKLFNVEDLKVTFNQMLSSQKQYLLDRKGRLPNTINLDFSPNNKRSIHLSRYSLTKDGLVCDDIFNSKRAGTMVSTVF